MFSEKEFTDTDGRLISTVVDNESGMAFVVGSLGGVVKLSCYLNDTLLREFPISQGGSLKLSDALRKAAYHGK